MHMLCDEFLSDLLTLCNLKDDVWAAVPLCQAPALLFVVTHAGT